MQKTKHQKVLTSLRVQYLRAISEQDLQLATNIRLLIINYKIHFNLL